MPFDSTNLVTGFDDAAGHSRSYDYDTVGNLIEIIDRNGKRRTFVYDENRRLTNERWHDGAGNVVREMIFAHQANKGLVQVEDIAGANTQVHEFDRMPRPASTQVQYPGQAEWKVTYSWSGDSRGPTNVSIRQGNRPVEASIRAAYYAGHLFELKWTNPTGGGKTVDFHRNLDSTLARIVRRSGFGTGPPHSQTHYTYDNLKALDTIVTKMAPAI